MLTPPKNGWTDFSPEGTGEYGLSYLSDIPFDWLEQAVRGLATDTPFCVTGELEPGLFVCSVGYRNSRIFEKEDDRSGDSPDDCVAESPVGMLDFCRLLHEDLSADLEGWACWSPFSPDEEFEPRIRELVRRLGELRTLIDEKTDRG